ncbi:globin domain-containing protein [Thermobifida halotolerans]|uniref:globin domain-containing protein n=1 Tax=Thermobifida halotolerans TaxID=483545 RepID=UPI000B13BF31|nr:globin domain-containing protein [Thermobifida halotolerans]
MSVAVPRGLPPLGPRTLEAVQAVCANLLEEPEPLAERFYHHLFRLLPSCERLFPPDMETQHVRMARVLVEAVRHLDEPGDTWDRLRELGGHHYMRWGLGPEEYRCVGHALVEAARDVSPEWTPSVGSAWVTVYEWISAAMLTGAAEAAARSSGRMRPEHELRRFGGHAGPRSGEGNGKPTVAS